LIYLEEALTYSQSNGTWLDFTPSTFKELFCFPLFGLLGLNYASFSFSFLICFVFLVLVKIIGFDESFDLQLFSEVISKVF